MRERDIQQALENIWNQELTPGIHNKKISAYIEETKKYLTELNQRNNPLANSIKETTTQLIRYTHEDLIRTITRPGIDPLLRNEYNNIRLQLEDILLEEEQPIHETRRIIIPHNNQITGTTFKHIPYSYSEGDIQEVTEINTALQGLQLQGIIEKTYQLTPKKATDNQLWNLELIGAYKAQETTKGKNTLVGIIDTGIDYKHKELAERFTNNKGYNFIYNNTDPFDDNGHGTHVAGTVAGTKTGIATETTLLALKMLNAQGYGREVDFIRACEYAIDNNIQLLNASLGSSRSSPSEKAICDIIQKQGILLVAAAGNDGSSTPHYPASYKSVISVGAVDRNKQRAPFSQTNRFLDLAAPGVNIYSTTPHDNHDRLSGTSMGTPHVTGSAALITSTGTNAKQTRELLEATAEDLGDSEAYGHGLVRPDQAIKIEGLIKRWAA